MMTSLLQFPKVYPELCLKCGHTFVPGAPEPSWCPDCGKLCSAFDVEVEEAPPEEEPEECRETPEHRRGWWRWFLMMSLAGPIGALLIGISAKQVVKLAPPMLKEVAEFATGGAGMACAVFCGAVGATYSVARLRRGQHRGESIVVIALSGFALFIAYLVICGLLVSSILRTFVK